MNYHKKIETDKAPKAIGPYSQAIIAGDSLYISGQLPIDPATGKIVEGGIRSQTEQVLKNLLAILNHSNFDISNVVKSEIFLKNMDDFKEMNEIYGSFFTFNPMPARYTVEVAKLPLDVDIEISCIAFKDRKMNDDVV